MDDAQRVQVVIVGGGFGGVYAARRLAGTAAEVTLLDRSTSTVFQPLLYQCATGLLSEGQITSPLRSLLRRHANIRVLLGEAHELDTTRRVLTARRPDRSTFELPYDHLVVAAGMRQSYFGHPEFAEHAPGMKNIDDALTIRRRVLGAFEMAETMPDPQQRREWLTFAVVGAGPTGVELAGQIRELATRTIEREYRTIDPAEARVLLFDGGTAVLASFGTALSANAQRTLSRLGVQVTLGVHVTDIDAAGLVTTSKDGTTARIAARTVLWTAGVEAVPFLAAVAHATGAVPDKQGRIPVEPDLSVAGHPRVRVIGDAMSRDTLPGVAEVAMQAGRYVGDQIRRQIADPGPPRSRSRSRSRFRYRDLGTAAYICRGDAVLRIGPVHVSGFPGWILWGVIHIGFLAGVRNRFATLASWLLTLGLNRRGERALTSGDPSTATQPY